MENRVRDADIECAPVIALFRMLYNIHRRLFLNCKRANKRTADLHRAQSLRHHLALCQPLWDFSKGVDMLYIIETIATLNKKTPRNSGVFF